jgi:hypothetical protein
MQPMCFSARARLMVLLALLLLGVCAFASDGHDFAARYNIHNAVEQGDSVHFTMNLTLTNASKADVKNAVLALGQVPGATIVGRTQPIKLLKAGDTTSLSQKFTISKGEYQRWLHGSTPAMFIVYTANGTAIQRAVVMAPQ